MGSKSNDPSLSTSLGCLGITLVMTPVNALISSWVLSEYWRMLVQPHYGPGPSMASWFGISSAVGLLASLALAGVKREENFLEVRQCVARQFGHAAGMLMSLLVTWATGSVLGWI